MTLRSIERKNKNDMKNKTCDLYAIVVVVIIVQFICMYMAFIRAQIERESVYKQNDVS